MGVSKNIFKTTTAVSFICVGLISILLRIHIFDFIISSIFVITPNSAIFDVWRKSPVELNTDIYLFNWTNPEDIHNLTIKPKFQELGPYSFKRVAEKVNITWNSNNTVTYRLLQSYYFDEKRSKGKLEDVVTTINSVTLTAVHKMKNDGYFTKRGFSFSLNMLAPTLHVSKPANELLFDGYQDPYVDLAQILSFAEDSSDVPERVGFVFNRNNSYMLDGTYNIANGIDGNIAEILNWNYHNTLIQYNGSCEKLGGSSGDFYPPKRTKTYLKTFIPDACSNFKLDYEKDVSVKDISGYKFSAQQSALDNGTLIPENKCFCIGDCIPSGVLNVTSCANGAPAFLSLPHYYGADSFYLNSVEGLSPEKSKHEMYVIIEPIVGFSLDMAIRLQLNFLLHPVKDITLYENVPTLYFPVLWFEQKFSFPDELGPKTKLLLSLPNITIPVMSIGLIIIGISLFIFNPNICNVIKLERLKRETIKLSKVANSCDKHSAKDEEPKSMLN